MCHARSAWWLETKSYARIVPPLPRSARQPQKEKMFLAFRICARPIFSLKGKDIFLWGSALQVFGQCGGASIRTRQSEKTIFLGKRIFRFVSALFPPAERGLGNECGRASFSFFNRERCRPTQQL